MKSELFLLLVIFKTHQAIQWINNIMQMSGHYTHVLNKRWRLFSSQTAQSLSTSPTPAVLQPPAHQQHFKHFLPPGRLMHDRPTHAWQTDTCMTLTHACSHSEADQASLSPKHPDRVHMKRTETWNHRLYGDISIYQLWQSWLCMTRDSDTGLTSGTSGSRGQAGLLGGVRGGGQSVGVGWGGRG